MQSVHNPPVRAENWPLRPLSPVEYARYERRLGTRVIEADGVAWRRVRPLFYRPLLPFLILDPGGLKGPRGTRWGGYQHAVRTPEQANSTLAFLMFRDVATYGLECLEKKRRWEVRSAAKYFEVKRLKDVSELAAAHPVYLDFRRRTGYRHRQDRVRAERFRQWAEAVLGQYPVLVLGAMVGGELQAVSVCLLVERTLIYATFFARENALKRHVASLMLHVIRSWAAASETVWQIYVGMRKTGPARSVDAFYLERGCEVVLQPARYRVNPFLGQLLRILRPGLWNLLTGTVWTGGTSRAELLPAEGSETAG